MFGLPILVGISRKSFIGKITGKEIPSERIAGTEALHMAALTKGAAILRVHDVSAARDTLLVSEAMMRVPCL